MAGHQLQMVALAGLCHASPRQEGPSEKGRPAALLLQQAEVDVEHRALPGVKAEGVDDPVDLFRVGELEDVLPLPSINLDRSPPIIIDGYSPRKPGGGIFFCGDQ